MAEAALLALAGSEAAGGIASRSGDVARPVFRLSAEPAASPRVQASEAGPFQSFGWAAAIMESYGFRSMEVMTGTRGEGRPVLPLMEINSPLTGRRGVSLPFSDFCAPVGDDNGATNGLIRSALEIGLQRGWRYLEFRDPRAVESAEVPFHSRYYSHRVPLSGGDGAVWSRLSEHTRRAVRKGLTGGLTVEAAHDNDAMDAFYRLLCLNRKRLGVPPQPRRFFRALHTHMLDAELGTMLVARRGKQVVAAGIYLHAGGQTIFKYGASDPDYLHLRPNNLITWTAIQAAVARGDREFHLGRNDLDNEGLRRYKLGWGAIEEPLGYVRLSPATGLALPPPAGNSSWKRAVMRRTPLPLARLIGELAYPHAA